MFSIILVSISLFIAIISFAYYLQTRIQERSKTEAELKLEQLIRARQQGAVTQTSEEEEKLRSQLLPSLGPLDKLVNWVKERFVGDSGDMNTWLDEQLMYAGLTNGDRRLTSQDVISYMAVYWTVIVAVTLFLAFVVQFPAFLVVLLAIIFLIYPPMRLISLRNSRQRQVIHELPSFMDDLIANLATGQTGIDEAIYAVVETNMSLPQRKRKILTEEFGQAYAEWRYGGRNRNQALMDIGRRLGVDSVNELVGLIVQGLDTGYPIRELLIKQSKSVKEVWKQEMRAYIARKRSSMMISVGLIAVGTLVLFIVPLVVSTAQNAGPAIG
jgi:Flp pilus assembly protein TadB